MYGVIIAVVPVVVPEVPVLAVDVDDAVVELVVVLLTNAVRWNSSGDTDLGRGPQRPNVHEDSLPLGPEEDRIGPSMVLQRCSNLASWNSCEARRTMSGDLVGF